MRRVPFTPRSGDDSIVAIIEGERERKHLDYNEVLERGGFRVSVVQPGLALVKGKENSPLSRDKFQ